MKSKLIIAFILGCQVFINCQKEKPYHEMVYFTDLDSGPVKKLVVSEESSTLDVTVTCSDKVNKDLIVSVEDNPELIGLYRIFSGKKNAEALPADSYQLSTKQVIIKGGTSVSEKVSISVNPATTFKQGVTYCIPLMIGGVSDPNIFVLDPSKIIYAVITPKIVTTVADLKGIYFSVPKFQEDQSLKLNAATMECRVYVNKFQSATPFISTVMGIEVGFLLRFGDISVDPNILQIAPCAVSGAKITVNSKTVFATKKWYHIALVFNGSAVSLYVDGKLDRATSAQPGEIDLTYKQDGGFYIGQSLGGRYLDGYISEARVWRKALSEAELSDGLCGVDPKSEGLVAYWKFNALIDGVVKDETGHGYDALPSSSVNFVEGVSCP